MQKNRKPLLHNEIPLTSDIRYLKKEFLYQNDQ
jgi:hypothetical protein